MKERTVSEILSKAVDCLDDEKDFSLRARYDAALNRSYYSMFHCIQALLYSSNVSAKSHKGAHNAFHKEFILSEYLSKDFGLSLKRTFEKRQFSDYDYDEVSTEDAMRAVEDAEHILDATVLYLKQNNFLQ